MHKRLSYLLPLALQNNSIQPSETSKQCSPLLIRQIEECFGNDIPEGNAFKEFLRAIHITYASYESEVSQIKQAAEIQALEHLLQEQRLLESEEYLREVEKQVPCLVFQCLYQTNSTLSFPFIGSGSTALFELSPQCIMTAPDALTCLLITPQGEKFEQMIRNSARTTEAWTWESQILTVAGKTKWVKAHASSRQLSNGDILWKGIFIDTTESKSTLEEISRQKKYYETFLNYIPFELAIFDARHRYVYLNQAAVKEEDVRQWMIDRDDFDYCREHSKDISIAENRRKTFLKAVNERQEAEIEELLPNAQGEPIYSIKRYCPIFNEKQELDRVLSYGINITDTQKVDAKVREKEEMLYSIISNIEVGIYRNAPGTSLVYLNQALAHMFGFESVEEALKTPIESLFANAEDHIRLLHDLAEKGCVKNREIPFIRKDGSSFWGQVSSNQVVGQQSTIQYDTVVKDITELRRTSNLLKEKNAELEKANAELDKFVYSSSHELRAPLTSILGLIGIAKMEDPAENQLNYLNLMEQSVNRLDKFIREIVHYSRNSKLEIQKEKIDFHSMIEDIIKDLYYIDGVDKICITTQIHDDISLINDAGRLKVIITNLISNAIRYHNLDNPNPYICIQVKTNREKAVIEVKDNGLGIEKEHLDKVFQMFYRASNHSKGSGIGLYIVKEMLAKLNGTIDLTSEPRQGTVFRVEIPQ